MKLDTIFKIGVLCSVMSAATSYGQTFNVDGYLTHEDSYTHKTAVYFYNGHKQEAYGTSSAPIYQTYVRWGQGKLSGDTSGPDFFFMYVETPLEVKNMVWGNEVTEADIAEYGVHYSNHHKKKPTMDYKQATGSEYMAFNDKAGKERFKSGLKPGKHSGGYGMIDAKTSVDYLLSHGATKDSSGPLGRKVGMAFEYQFALDGTENNALLDIVRDGGIIEYHLSPERGLVPTQVPEPSGAVLVMLSSALLLRRKR